MAHPPLQTLDVLMTPFHLSGDDMPCFSFKSEMEDK
jgi:hypothetical protein